MPVGGGGAGGLSVQNVRTLLISGGGARGYCLPGALNALDHAFQRETGARLQARVHAFYGISIGAIVSLLLALRAPLPMVRKLLFGFDQHEIIRQMNPVDLLRTFGLVDGERVCGPTLRAWCEQYTGKANVTFRELRTMHATTLVVYATRLNGVQRRDEMVVRFDADRTPDVAVWRAVVASAALPLVFTPVQIDGALYIDGGIGEMIPRDPDLDPDETLALFLGPESDLPYLNAESPGSFMEYLQRVGTVLRALAARLDFQETPRDAKTQPPRLGAQVFCLTSGVPVVMLPCGRPADTVKFNQTHEDKVRLTRTVYVALREALEPGWFLRQVWPPYVRDVLFKQARRPRRRRPRKSLDKHNEAASPPSSLPATVEEEEAPHDTEQKPQQKPQQPRTNKRARAGHHEQPPKKVQHL